MQEYYYINFQRMISNIINNLMKKMIIEREELESEALVIFVECMKNIPNELDLDMSTYIYNNITWGLLDYYKTKIIRKRHNLTIQKNNKERENAMNNYFSFYNEKTNLTDLRLSVSKDANKVIDICLSVNEVQRSKKIKETGEELMASKLCKYKLVSYLKDNLNWSRKKILNVFNEISVNMNMIAA